MIYYNYEIIDLSRLRQFKEILDYTWADLVSVIFIREFGACYIYEGEPLSGSCVARCRKGPVVFDSRTTRSVVQQYRIDEILSMLETPALICNGRFHGFSGSSEEAKRIIDIMISIAEYDLI